MFMFMFMFCVGGGGGKISADLDYLVSSKDGEIRALKLELHRTRRDTVKMAEVNTTTSAQKHKEKRNNYKLNHKDQAQPLIFVLCAAL